MGRRSSWERGRSRVTEAGTEVRYGGGQTASRWEGWGGLRKRVKKPKNQIGICLLGKSLFVAAPSWEVIRAWERQISRSLQEAPSV